MTLTRWDPFRELEEMTERLNRIFGATRPTLGRVGGEGRETLAAPEWAPAVDIAETAEEYIIKAELPEVQREDVKVTVENGVLSIRGERKREKEEKGKKFHRIERAYGAFMRSFALPDDVDEAKVSAQFKDGVLNIHLPKTEKAKPRAIEVKVG